MGSVRPYMVTYHIVFVQYSISVKAKRKVTRIFIIVDIYNISALSVVYW
jgi:hypothetical protein